MKLSRIKINDPKGFRSLQYGFELFFLKEWDSDDIDNFNPYILAGPNGSGKSNVLEALAAIFYHIECVYLNYQPENFEYDEKENPDGFRADRANPDAFELEYFIPVSKILSIKKRQEKAHVKIEKKIGETPEIYWVNRSLFEELDNCIDLSRIQIKELLPKYIIGYSSGENELLSLSFFKMRFIHFDEYRDFLIKDDFYGQVPEGRLIYLDDQLSQSILLSNLILQPQSVLQIFENELNLSGAKEFRILIGKHRFEIIHDDLFITLSEEDKNDVTKTQRELTSKLQKTIDKFIKCSTIKQIIYDENGLEQFIILDYFVDETTKEAFRFHFNDSPLELFQAFQILYTLNYYTIDQIARDRIYKSKNIYLKQDMTSISLDENSIFRIKEFRLNKGGIDDVIYTKALSDGEHQFIHSIGLCLLFKDESCLILLDEPETHFNPDWRAKFISRLRECFLTGKAINTIREMLITTHTSYLISDSKKEYVLLFSKEKESNTILVSRPSFNTLGASINKITMEAFKKPETIGGYALEQLDKLKERYELGENGDEIISETNKMLGDSVEKILFINKILNNEEEK